MQLLKFKSIVLLITFLLVLPVFGNQSFTDNQCLDGVFTTKVAHKAFPFGWTETKLEIEKKECRLIVRHEKLRYLTKQWDVDVCRGPIHIKYGATSVEVIKRHGACKTLDNDFCKMSDELFRILQDDGLIFAPGEKEDLSTAHGRVNCSYLLLKAYLEGAIVFSRQEAYEGVLKKFSNLWESVTPEEVTQVEQKQISLPKQILPDPVATPDAESIPTAAPEQSDF